MVSRFSRSVCLLAICVGSLLISHGIALAQPKIQLVDPVKKAYLPTAGSIPIIFKNIGTFPLVIGAVQINQYGGTEFSWDSTQFNSLIVAAGETGYITIYYHSAIAYEYDCDVLLTTNDATNPIAKVHVRVNDSIPPNKVRKLHEYPLKNGFVRFAWSTPLPPSDLDTVGQYEVYAKRYVDDNFVFLGTTRDTSFLAQPAGDGLMYYAVVTYDNMGNHAVQLDTGWTALHPPDVSIAHVDITTNALPEHLAKGLVELQVESKTEHPSYFRISYRDTARNAPLTTIAEYRGYQAGNNNVQNVQWNTSALHGIKDVVIFAHDSVSNDTTVTERFQLTQLEGWPRYTSGATPMPGCISLSVDAGGPFLLAGSDIAAAEFRLDGSPYYNWWPLSVVRSSADMIITATAELDKGHNGLETVVGSANNDIFILSSDGRAIREFGALQQNAEILSVTTDSIGNHMIAAGSSPVVIRDQVGMHVVGAQSLWTPQGDPVNFDRVLPLQDLNNFDRYVAGSLDRSGEQVFVRVHDGGPDSGETVAVYDTKGNLKTGWPQTLWHPTTQFKGFYPSLGDIDGDGKLEIVIPTANDSLWAFHADGSVVSGYPTQIATTDCGHNQALIVDVDGDGAGDIILPTRDSIQCINGKTGQPMGGMWPIYRKGQGENLLTVADLNSDGFLELIEPPAIADTGSWVYVYQLSAKNFPGTIQWGTFQHDMQRTGNYDTTSSFLAGIAAHTSFATTPECRVFPLPATDQVTVQLDQRTSETWQRMDLIDVTGKTVWTSERNKELVGRNIQLPISQLTSGTYFLTIHAPTTTLHARIVRGS